MIQQPEMKTVFERLVERLSKGRRVWNARRSGFSLITALTLGAVSTLWLFAITATVWPMYQRAFQGRYYTVLRSAAEAGLDYTLAALNQAYTSGVPCAMDDTNAGDGIPQTSSIPPQALGGSAATVTVDVNNVPAPAWSTLYNPLLDPAAPNQTSGVTQNSWRVVTVTASYAGLTRKLRVVLYPTIGPGAASNRNPFFQFAMFAKSGLTMAGTATTAGYDSSNVGAGINQFGGNVASNGSVNLRNSASIGGDLFVTSMPMGSSSAVVASASGSAQVLDQVKVNGITSGLTGTPGPTPQPGDNVQGAAGGTPRSGDYATPIDSSLSQSQQDTYPALTPPSTKQMQTGMMTWSGNDGYVTQPVPADMSGNGGTVVSLGAFAAPSGKTIHLQPGDYQANSLSIPSDASVVIEPNNDGSFAPVRIFVDGTSPGSTAIQMSGTGINNQSNVPGNLQLWYNGSKSVSMSLSSSSSLYGVLYAPNAGVSVGGAGTYFGALVGNTLSVSGSPSFVFDLNLQKNASSFGLNYNKSTASATASLAAVSWQEYQSTGTQQVSVVSVGGGGDGGGGSVSVH